MKNKLFVSALSGLIPLVMSATALAVPLNYNFGGSSLGVAGDDEYNSVSMMVDDVNVDVTAFTIENNGSGSISSMSQIIGAGLGVYVRNSSGGSLGVRSNTSDDGYNMDGGRSGSTTDLDEGLRFFFSEVVSLQYVNFDSFSNSSGDDFNLTVDGVLQLVDFGPHDSSSLAVMDAGEHDAYNFSGITGQSFLFWTDGNTDSFRIDRMTVTAVPEPASLLLMGAGLAGFGFARRKKTS